jgi:hypothetical protein
VTLGNIIGGTLLVGAVYWFVYLRQAVPAPMAPKAVEPPATVPEPAAPSELAANGRR